MIRAGLRAVFALALLSGIASASGDPASAMERDLEEFLNGTHNHPEEYLDRAARAWLQLGNGPAREWTGGAPDALAPMPEGHPVVLELRAYYLHQLAVEYAAMAREGAAKNIARGGTEWRQALQGHYLRIRKLYGKSANRLLAATEPSHYRGPAIPRFLAEIALLRRDTAAAQEAYRAGWKEFGLEEDFISLLNLRRVRGDVEEALLGEGLRAHTLSPAVHAAVLVACLEGGSAAHRALGLEVASRGQSELWPSSVDWKIRHAQALLANELPREARKALLAALELADREPQLKVGTPMTIQARQEIFALLAELPEFP